MLSDLKKFVGLLDYANYFVIMQKEYMNFVLDCSIFVITPKMLELFTVLVN